ncbi:MAG: tRNA pseudouridine(55) synthase TruB [Schleiferiaceae bacterium]|nr:tRNA pseudouridine(55) synthase TruB [Schleiferiaceae bacterium]MDR9441311.1 tRNA pseudouridine(55) synthase TruB [Schleiferiaceae bacterium]
MALDPEQLQSGFTLLVNKPLRWTSFDVVNKLRYTFRHASGLRKLKLGHAGTLDPLATGLLILGVGRHTKRIEEYMGLPKTYRATLQLGYVTDSYDAETSPQPQGSFEHLNMPQIEQNLAHFRGEIWQKPPIFSALKVKGQKAYELARKGAKQDLPARPVQIQQLQLTDLTDTGRVQLLVDCSKGTYIRSLAHDLGTQLGCGAYLAGLERTAIGNYHLRDAWELEQLVAAIEKDQFDIPQSS